MNKKIIFKKEMPKWKEKSPFEKGSTVFTLILSISVLILSTLTLVGSQEGAIFLSEPLIGLLMLNQTVQYWKYNKAVAILSLIAALVSLAQQYVYSFSSNNRLYRNQEQDRKYAELTEFLIMFMNSNYQDDTKY